LAKSTTDCAILRELVVKFKNMRKEVLLLQYLYVSGDGKT